MIVAYVIGSVLVWAAIAFGLAALFRGTADRSDAHGVAWITAFWPVTIPVIAVFMLIMGVMCGGVWVLIQIGEGIVKLGGRYIDFIHGKKKPPPLKDDTGKKLRGMEKRYMDGGFLDVVLAFTDIDYRVYRDGVHQRTHLHTPHTRQS